LGSAARARSHGIVRYPAPGVERSIRDRLKDDPTAWATVARHALPVAMVVGAGWSALETLVAMLLDATSVLACAAAVASTVTTRSFAHRGQGPLDRLSLVAGGAVIFAIVTALLLFAAAVPMAGVWLAALRGRESALVALVDDPWLQASFAGMLAAQVPRYAFLVRTPDVQSARRVVEAEVGFVLLRLVLIGGAAGLLGLLPAGWALLATLVLVQTVLAATEILADGQLAGLLAARAPGDRQARRSRARR